jgi:hypothetical protein
MLNQARGMYEFRGIQLRFENDEEDGILLWERNMQALPALVNLAHLCFMPRTLCVPYATGDILRRCQFQLKSLEWSCSDMERDGLPEFLLTQKSLVHLDIQPFYLVPGHPPGARPSLASVACRFSYFSFIAIHRNVQGYKTALYSEWNTDSYPASILGQIKYLAVQDNAPHTPFPNIILLEIADWNMEVRQNSRVGPTFKKLTRPFNIRPTEVWSICRNCAPSFCVAHPGA